MKSETLWETHRSLTIKKTKNTLTFGSGSHAFETDSHILHLEKLIEAAQTPSTQARLLNTLITSGLAPTAARQLLDESKNIGMIVPASPPEDRLHRHGLYFQYEGISLESMKTTLAQKTVLLIGVGGIGSQSATLLNAAGVGHLILVDSDRIELGNLTRTTLFDESDVGTLKSKSAAKRLRLKNSGTRVTSFPLALETESYSRLVKFAQNCDFILLSGDSGPEVHILTDRLARDLHVPYLNAGYVERLGVVGPLHPPGSTLLDQELKESQNESSFELNSNLQAPSFGPLNGLVSSIAVNEVIRSLLGLPCTTLGQRLIIDSVTYEVEFQDFIGGPLK